MTYRVDILNPKAEKLLHDFAELKLISIQEVPVEGFLKTVSKLRSKAKKSVPSLDTITKEVESVRGKRFAKKKR